MPVEEDEQPLRRCQSGAHHSGRECSRPSDLRRVYSEASVLGMPDRLPLGKERGEGGLP